jgi:ligand-binding sensor domain-containing protein
MYVLFAIVAVAAVGCESTTKPPPPPSPAHINLVAIQGMPSDDVFDVFVDSKDRVWVSTEQGLLMFPNAQASSYKVADAKWFTDREGIPNLRCRALAELNKKIYVGTWGGGIGIGDSLAIYSPTGKWETVGPDEGLPIGRVTGLAADDSSIWLATVEGVYQYVDNPLIPVEDRIIDHTSTSEFGDGVFSSIIVHNSDTRGPEVWASENRRDVGGVFVPGGIRVLRFPGSQYFNTSTSAIPSNDVNAVAYDPAADLIWSGHAFMGIASLDVDARTWVTYNMANGLVSDLVSAIAVNNLNTPWKRGTVWIATQNGLTKMDPDGTMTNYTDGSGLLNLRVRNVRVDMNNNVWLSFVDTGAARVKP